MLSKSNLWRALTILALLALFVTPFSTNGRALASQPQQGEQPAENGALGKPVVRSSSRNDTSPALREMKPVELQPGPARDLPFQVLPKALGKGMKSEPGRPAEVQDKPVPPKMPAYVANFEGVNNVDGVLPPDTNGDIGVDPDTGTKYYMQWVNLSLQIWDVTDPTAPVNLLPAPVDGNTLFSGFGGVCETTNDGDPIVLFDHLANRWLASQFALPNYPNGPFYECIAISQTADPTGAWHRYEFLISNTKMDDYPKFGVWPDAYYMSVNQFNPTWAGAGAVAFERDAMLTGATADMVYFDLGAVTTNYGGMLPSDLDGAVPPAGAPNFFAEWDDSSRLGDPDDTLRIWEFHVDWTTPANSTFGLNASYDPNYLIATGDVDPNLCGYSRNCIPQPGGTAVDAISDRLMNRLQYRNFGSHQALVSNHTVDVGGDHAGIHWFELRDSGIGWELYQDGVYAPDSAHRWMGSAALDVNGNLALGYSVSSTTVYPSIRYTGRLAGDPLNTLPQGEAVLIAGSGYQTDGSGRWGDYSMMGVDPVDECTFWYTQEYYEVIGARTWQTRIGSFNYPTCAIGPSGDLEGTVTDASSGDPLEGVKISLEGGLVSYTDATGFYNISSVPVGTYDTTASLYGYVSETANGVEILDSDTTTQNFSLAPAEMVTVQGKVTDGSGHPGMPLYARLDVSGYPSSPVFTNPVNGHYSLELPAGGTFTFDVSAISPGYNGKTRDVTPPPGGSVENFALTVDAAACVAPGYALTRDGLHESFDSGALPAGWSVVDNTGDGGWAFDNPGGRDNLTGGEGLFAIVDSDYYGGSAFQDTELITPLLDFSALSIASLEFDTDFTYYSSGLVEVADVDVSNDGGTSWNNVWSKSSASYPGPKHEVVDITSLAAGQPDVKARFHYYNANYEWWWQVDNAYFGAPTTCDPIPGGLLVGNVYDQNNGQPLNGALVASDGASDSTTTGETPDDPNLDDGFYMLFSSLTGAQPFTASMSGGYGSSTEQPTIEDDDTVRQDFNLPAGMLGADPTSFTVTLAPNQTVDQTLTLSNTGGLAADFEVREREGSVETDVPGAPVKFKSGFFSPYRIGFTPKAGMGIDRPIPRPDAPPWMDIASYPSAIMDNTASVLDGKVYSVAGYDGVSNLSSGQVYDPDGDSWAPIASMSFVREKPAAAFVDGLLYVVGGWDDSGNPVAALEIYDPAADAWTTGASVPTAYAAAAGVGLDGQFYVIGGCGNGFCGVIDTYRYDPGSDSWTQLADYPEPISWSHCGAITGMIYCAGGMKDYAETASTYVYDPAADAWTPLADMPQTQWAGSFTAANGLLYVSGGVTDDFATITNETFVYTPISDSWAPDANSNNLVYRGASACGFYKVGGSIGSFSPVPDSEVYPGLTNCETLTDVTWLSENPVNGSIPAGGSESISLTFDSTGLELGTYEAHLRITEDTPYVSFVVPVTLIVTEDQPGVIYLPLILKNPSQ